MHVLGMERMSIIYFGFAAFILISSLASLPKANAKYEIETQRSAKLLFRQQCSKCHGMDGRAQSSKGKFSHARDLTDPKWQDDVTDERIFNSIMNGRNVRGNMPKFADRFSEAEVNGLVTFVRDLRSK
jgi:mono/diheme cytochrome c family protein